MRVVLSFAVRIACPCPSTMLRMVPLPVPGRTFPLSCRVALALGGASEGRGELCAQLREIPLDTAFAASKQDLAASLLWHVGLYNAEILCVVEDEQDVVRAAEVHGALQVVAGATAAVGLFG